MQDNLLNNLQKLQAKYTESSSQKTLQDWEKRVTDALIVDSLKEHEGIKIILDTYKKEIEDINNILLHSEEITEPQRLRIMDKRAMRQRFLSYFEQTKQIIESVEKLVEEQL
jgi:hypothetical protein